MSTLSLKHPLPAPQISSSAGFTGRNDVVADLDTSTQATLIHTMRPGTTYYIDPVDLRRYYRHVLQFVTGITAETRFQHAVTCYVPSVSGRLICVENRIGVNQNLTVMVLRQARTGGVVLPWGARYTLYIKPTEVLRIA